MSKSALVFSGRNGLDFIELRQGVVRIPEVTLRLREAQRIFDAKRELSDSGEGSGIDLLSVLCSEDEMFFKNIQLKSLVSAIVQVGLFDRYCKSQKRPDFLVGNSNGDSAMLVASGQISFQSMVETSQAVSNIRPVEKTIISLVPASAMPLLSGLNLTEYSALEAKKVEGTAASQYVPMDASSMDLRQLITVLNQDHGVSCFINIGPASALRGSDYRNLGCGDLESLDSIELDPMLGWFWRNVRPQAVALAQ